MIRGSDAVISDVNKLARISNYQLDEEPDNSKQIMVHH
jgi:hypothetical protein